MKKINTHTVFRGLFLGLFFGTLLFSTGQVGAADPVKCLELKDNVQGCKTAGHCRWVDDGEKSTCLPAAQICWDVNSEPDTAKRKDLCIKNGCGPEGEKYKGTCRPPEEYCLNRDQSACQKLSDVCVWDVSLWNMVSLWGKEGTCILKPEKYASQAVSALAQICYCECNGERSCKKGSMSLNTGDCDSPPKSDYWDEDGVPNLCVPPLTSGEVETFCRDFADRLSDKGREACRNAMQYAANAIAQNCIDDAEMSYQSSLKDEAARQLLEERKENCNRTMDNLYPGATFVGSGLKGGAILAHQKLTKSISHQTDLKTFILGWVRFSLELVAILAVVAVVWAGILYITDLGDGGNQEKAKKILMWVAIGVLLILGSYAIVNTLMSADFSDSAHLFNSLHV